MNPESVHFEPNFLFDHNIYQVGLLSSVNKVNNDSHLENPWKILYIPGKNTKCCCIGNLVQLNRLAS